MMADFDKRWKPSPTKASSNQLWDRSQELRSALRLRDPASVAARSDISFQTVDSDRGELHIPFWNDLCILSWPELIGFDTKQNPLSDFQVALLLYYLITADGTAPTGKWVSFAELPGGRTYDLAFQSYSGDRLAKTFGPTLDSFRTACVSSGGREVEAADCSFLFQALPRLPLMVTYWLGDEDFPSSCKILFDESACHYLPIDVCAILGNMLTRRLIKIGRNDS